MGWANEYFQKSQMILGILMIGLAIIFLIGIVGYFNKYRQFLFFSLVLIVGETLYYIGGFVWIIIVNPPDLGYSLILFLLIWFTGFLIHASIILYTWGLYDKVKNKAIA